MKYQLIEEKTYNDYIEQVLHNRGISDADMYDYLNPYSALENDYHLLDNITAAVNRICLALPRKDNVYIQVDCDCDGYTSAAALLNYLHSMFPATVDQYWTWGLHKNKEHGIEEEAVIEWWKAT